MDAHIRNHRWARFLLPAVAFLLLGAFVGCRIVGTIFRGKLIALVKKDLKADLVIGSVIYSLPFAVQPLREAFEAIGERPFEAAASLRASPLDAFFSVGLPLARRRLDKSIEAHFWSGVPTPPVHAPPYSGE